MKRSGIRDLPLRPRRHFGRNASLDVGGAEDVAAVFLMYSTPALFKNRLGAIRGAQAFHFRVLSTVVSS